MRNSYHSCRQVLRRRRGHVRRRTLFVLGMAQAEWFVFRVARPG